MISPYSFATIDFKAIGKQISKLRDDRILDSYKNIIIDLNLSNDCFDFEIKRVMKREKNYQRWLRRDVSILNNGFGKADQRKNNDDSCSEVSDNVSEVSKVSSNNTKTPDDGSKVGKDTPHFGKVKA